MALADYLFILIYETALSPNNEIKGWYGLQMLVRA